MFEAPHDEIKFVLSIKESKFNEQNGSKFSHLLTVRAQGADPPPYGQPGRKISAFYDDFPYNSENNTPDQM